MTLLMVQTIETDVVAADGLATLRETLQDVGQILDLANASVSFVDAAGEPLGRCSGPGKSVRLTDLASRAARSAAVDAAELKAALCDWASDVYDFMADGDPGVGSWTVVLPVVGIAAETAYAVVVASRPVAQLLLGRLMGCRMAA